MYTMCPQDSLVVIKALHPKWLVWPDNQQNEQYSKSYLPHRLRKGKDCGWCMWHKLWMRNVTWFPRLYQQKFPRARNKRMFRGCPGCPQDVWFIIVMFPQLSACRKSSRKYVILLKNKQGPPKLHYWPKAGNTTKPNIIQFCWKEPNWGKSGGFFLGLLV